MSKVLQGELCVPKNNSCFFDSDRMLTFVEFLPSIKNLPIYFRSKLLRVLANAKKLDPAALKDLSTLIDFKN